MARPQKQGLSYFPLDVDIDQDDKVALIEAAHGQVGFAIIIKLLMKIYKEGYFYEWTEKEQLLFSKRVNVNINELNVIINDCVKWDLFNKTLFDQCSILTSKGIQKRFFEASTRRKDLKIIKEYLLTNMPDNGSCEVNVNNNNVNVNINVENEVFSTQTKLNKSKQNKSKEKETIINKSEPIVVDEKNVFYQFESLGFGVMSQHFKEQLEDLEENYSSAWVIEAMQKSVEQGYYKISYVKGILQNWKSKGKDAPKPIYKNGKEIKKDFKEREYSKDDFEDLEKKLLGWG